MILLIRLELAEDPKVLRLAELTGQEVDLIVGKLVRLWAEATRYRQDGLLPTYSLASLDGWIGLPGFAAALTEIGWLEFDLLGAHLLGWEQYLGVQGVRALMEEWLTDHPRPMANSSVPGEPGFMDFWSEYPRKEGRKDALAAWRKLRPNEPTRQKIMEALRAAKRGEQWTKDDGQFVPHASTWLNGERWTDERPAPPAGPGRVQAPPGKYDHLKGPQNPGVAQPAQDGAPAEQGPAGGAGPASPAGNHEPPVQG